MKTRLDFRSMLQRFEITPTEYAELVGLDPNTVYRRARGETGIHPEAEGLLWALASYSGDLRSLLEKGRQLRQKVEAGEPLSASSNPTTDSSKNV